MNVNVIGKALLNLADEIYKIGADGEETTEMDSVAVEADIKDSRGKRHVKVVITERSVDE